MKDYLPDSRFIELSDCLRYCSSRLELGKEEIFTPGERFSINQERAKLLDGLNTYQQEEQLECKIQITILIINK